MITSERAFFGAAPYQGEWLLGQEDSGLPTADSGGGFSLSDVGKYASKAGELVSTGSKIVGQVTGKTTTPSTGKTAPLAKPIVLAPGADWRKVHTVIGMPMCTAQYEALFKEYKRRMSAQYYTNLKAKIHNGTPLTQSDLNAYEWFRTANQRLSDFRSMYGETKAAGKWPTSCPAGSGVGIPGYKGGALGTGVSSKYVYVGIGVLALGAVAFWILK